MLDSATEAVAASDTIAPASTPAPVSEARISSKDMSTLADKVSDAATPKSDAERAEKDASDLKAEQVKAYRRVNKDRDEGGKYKTEADNARDASKALSATPDSVKAEPKATDPKPAVDAKIAATPPATDVKEIKAPQSWSAEKRAVWDTLAPDAKEYIAQREAEAHKAISKYGQFATGVKPIVETLETYRDVFESKGLSYQEGMKSLLDAQRMLDRDPAAGIEALARAYGVDLGQSLTSQRDPAISQLQSQVEQLTAQLRSAQSESQQRQQAEHQSKQSSIEKVINDCSKDKPDFSELEADIVANVRLLHETNPELSHAERLQMAYERAQWGNPKSRAAALERQAKELESKRLEDAKRHAEHAGRARAINVTSEIEPTGDLDLRTLQQAAFRRASAR